MTSANLQEILRTKVNLETSRIAWKELQRFFASGAVILVSSDLDLVEVTFQISEDNKPQVAQWLSGSKIGPVSDAQALAWYEADADVWAVVVSPYVLIQEVKDVLHSREQ
jgi:hypothetical protein